MFMLLCCYSCHMLPSKIGNWMDHLFYERLVKQSLAFYKTFLEEAKKLIFILLFSIYSIHVTSTLFFF